MIRHVLSDNHWELPCPVCNLFVPIDYAVHNGLAPFPAHVNADGIECLYREPFNWRALMPSSGISSMGPLA